LKNPFTYPFSAALLLLVTVIISYSLFEFVNRPGEIDERDITADIEQSLLMGQELFTSVYEEFVDDSNQLYRELSELPLTTQNRSFVFNRFEDYDFWGVSLYRDNTRWVWKGFNLTPVSMGIESDGESVSVNLLKRNNVVYLFSQQSFQTDDNSFALLTARKIELTSNLPFASQVVYDLSTHPDLSDGYPVNFNFFNPVADDRDLIHKKLSIESSDSVGIVYASYDDAEIYKLSRENLISKWRVWFHLTIFITFFILIVIWSGLSRNIFSDLFRFVLVLTCWVALFQSGVMDYWNSYFTALFNEADPKTITGLISYLFNSLFIFLLFIIVFNASRLPKSETGNQYHFRTLFLSIVLGSVSAVMLLYFILTTQNILVESTIPLLDLELTPDPKSFFFYISSTLFFTGIGGIIISAAHYLYRKEQDKSTVIAVTALFSFILFYYLADLFLSLQSIFSWVFLLATGQFLIFLWIVHVIHKHTYVFREMSGFRKLMFGILLSSTAVYIIVWNSSNDRLDRELLDRADTFANEEIADTHDILTTLLTDLEKELIFLSGSDIENQTLIAQAQFQRAIRSSIQPEWRNHSFEIQLLSTRGELVSDYSTNLDSPGWRSLVDMALMSTSYREQQIRRITNRPIIYERPVNLGENYISFNRGWIPIYDEAEANVIIAWIFGAAYLERPDYNKPMRAVLAAATSEDWKQSYYMSEFTDNRLTRTAMQGIYNNQPEYNRIPARESEIAARDSIAFITNITAQGSFREILLKAGDQRIIKASTPVYRFNHHIFSYFRLQIVLVFFGLFIFTLLAVSGLKSFSLFGQSRKFKHRLLDGLTLATILFLTVLIFATQYAVGNQNEESVERELVTKLNSLSESLRGEVNFQQTQVSSTRLTEFASPLNVDAVLYSGANVIDSTTPQIFQQHLMPRSMPYPAYDFLYNRERRHYTSTAQIGNETLLIGYRVLLDNQNRPTGAIAIPTFVQSPVYKEQLLETISYLFGVYLAIFALFIVGTVFLSNKLTKPLQIIQSGLNKISRGDMKTQVAVTSQDEIGTLAQAYNQMVARLDEVQKELLLAEREAAWKEMAQQVAHEIKNPLTPMKLNLQHLQRQLEANPDNVMELKPVIERTAANVIEQIDSLNKIASDFSKFAKPVQDPLKPLNLNRLVDSVANLYKNDESVTVTLRQPSDEIKVMASEDELRRALINLVKNGIEARENGHASIGITVKKQKNDVLISIRDDGSGIANDDRSKIFVPNFSTKSSGTGLGLAITKKIMEAHHADIRFESEEGKGTTFFITIPLMD
jgi:signal transduction histidine kinase